LVMPRTSRGGFACHLLNRGNGRSDVFHKDDDFAAFVNLMQEAHEKVPMRLTGFCLMTKHFHLAVIAHRLVVRAGRRELQQTSDWNHRFDRTADQNAQISRAAFAIPPFAIPNYKSETKQQTADGQECPSYGRSDGLRGLYRIRQSL